MDVLDDAVKEEEIVEGMEAREGHGDGEDEDHEEEEEGPEYDEHVWLSLRNAKVLLPDALRKQKPASGQSTSCPAKRTSPALPPFLP